MWRSPVGASSAVSLVVLDAGPAGGGGADDDEAFNEEALGLLLATTKWVAAMALPSGEHRGL